MDIMSQKKYKMLTMNHSWLQILTATLLVCSVTSNCNMTSETVTCEESAKSYFSIPSKMNGNVSVLHLSNNKIALNETDIMILNKYSNITELYLNNNTIAVLQNHSFDGLSKLVVLDLSNNFITKVEQTVFAGLNKLATLYLQNNKISKLDSNTFVLLNSLRILNLQNNNFVYFDIKMPFNSIRITLSENPWNCSCDLFSLQHWLNNPNITIENENSTVCDSPKSLKKYPIKAAFLDNCQKTEMTESTSASTTLISTNNTNRRSYSNTGFQPPGKSWTFLMGVLVIIVGTTMLIVIAFKFPAWYRYLISYNHSRLEEDEPEMFEETFTPHTYTYPETVETNEEEPVVVFEQFHTFVPDEDGFIEDKYIES